MKKILGYFILTSFIFSLSPVSLFAFNAECTGGTVTHSGGKTIHKFTNSGTLDCTNSGSGTVVILVVAGGGGGGSNEGGGGGAGGVIFNDNYSLTAQEYTVTIGSGGVGKIGGEGAGSNGSNSVFNDQTAVGGGGGGGAVSPYSGDDAPDSGGSGGGGTYPAVSGASGTSGQGYGGGNGHASGAGGGGGGAGGAGGSSSGGSTGGVGGIGVSDSMVGNLLSLSSSGVDVSGTRYIAGGGGGGYSADGGNGGGGAGGNPSTNGTPNTGGGGGGKGNGGSTTGGDGGSGIVIVSYDTPSMYASVDGSGNVNRLAKFTASTTIQNALLSDDGANTTLTSGNLFMPIDSILDTITSGSLNFGTTFATTMSFGSSSQKMIINSDVGIGTSSPTSNLEVNGSFFAKIINILAGGLGIDTYTPGLLSIGSTTATSINIGRTNATTTISGPLKVTNLNTVTICNSTTTPSTCGSAVSGNVAMPTGGSTLVVNTTSVTENSQIFVNQDSSLGTKLGITCNTVATRVYSISARVPGTSFTIKSSANPATNKACLSYFIVN